ncbi:hypothetical protein HMPREF1991_01681 [Hoylesella loescheii DSM 19665 = JCM 12249 = ATCC 15930]|uniref:Uncharacterized protein n=1 Tax=Hoylesella loescheii DSM 19665 = JCM 12249 = ATCC 15930 TaxID=1122985 RepID=A0A069QQZ6_HOYLO|nr:hypothetical protein HMPREF1991_01681 [Hoylesella loescheii DSM 19665 = JCM 12249 = ATCC 15930]
MCTGCHILFFTQLTYSRQHDAHSKYTSLYVTVYEFEIIDVRYVNCRVALVGEVVIRFLSNLTQQGIASYPEFT